MDVVVAVTTVVRAHPAVNAVHLVGSQSRGSATALSDWDFRIDATDPELLMQDLPALVQPLQPLAAQWDRLSERAVFMLILPGGIKVDLFPGDRPHAIEPPWRTRPGNLSQIDAHFWDWILWLAAKVLRDQVELVDAELQKLETNLLGPLGAETAPSSVSEAVDQFLDLRRITEQRFNIVVDRRLGEEVVARLRDEQLLA